MAGEKAETPESRAIREGLGEIAKAIRYYADRLAADDAEPPPDAPRYL